MSDSDKRFFVKYFCIDLKSANIWGKISAGKGLIGNLRRRWRKGLARLLIFLHADLEEFRRNRIAGVGNGWRDLSIFTANFSCRGRQGLARPLVFFTANVREWPQMLPSARAGATPGIFYRKCTQISCKWEQRLKLAWRLCRMQPRLWKWTQMLPSATAGATTGILTTTLHKSTQIS